MLLDQEGLEASFGGPRFLVVLTPQAVLERAAERCRIRKATIPDIDFYDPAFPHDCTAFVRSNAKDVFLGYGDKGFFTPAEEAELVVDAMYHVEAPAPLVPSNNLLLPGLEILGLIEVVAPLHNQTELKKVWDAARSALFVPEDVLCRYFGTEVALYFAWLNYFTLWLMVPSAVGLLFFLHMQYDVHYAVDNHPYLPLYSFMVVFWAAAFTAFWRRKSARKVWDWGTDCMETVAEVRPNFHGELRKSRITGQPERFFPYYKRCLAYCVSSVVTACMLCVAFCIMILSLNLQGYIDGKIKWEEPLHFPMLSRYAVAGAIFDPNQTEYFGVLALIPTLLHVIIIMQLNGFYRNVAEWLTERENHRLKSDHESSVVLKRFLFESFDCYISLFYLGFVQQDIRRLRVELISLYTVDSLRRAACEMVLPYLLTFIKAKTQRDAIADIKKRDSKGTLLPAFIQASYPDYEPFDDYLEMVIEFGYVTLFAASFPLAALLSVVCNFIEMKSDLFKLYKVYRRPVPKRVASIGVWQTLIRTLMWLSIFTNTFLFVSSEQLAAHVPWLYRHSTEKDLLDGRVAAIGEADHDLVVKRGGARWVLVIAFVVERVVFLLCLLLQHAIPDVPEEVAMERERQAHLQERIRRKVEGKPPSSPTY